mgnify:CR=1 FL=1
MGSFDSLEFCPCGGFLGAYAILLHMGNFGSAQTGNIMEMAASLVSGEWYDVLLRFLALPLFGGGVVVSYILTNHTNINMRKLAIVVDAAGLVVILITAVKSGAGWTVSRSFLLSRFSGGCILQQTDITAQPSFPVTTLSRQCLDGHSIF